MGNDLKILEDMIDCADRELEKRKLLYPKWVKESKMTKAHADKEIDTMSKILFFLTLVRNGKSPQNIQLRLL